MPELICQISAARSKSGGSFQEGKIPMDPLVPDLRKVSYGYTLHRTKRSMSFEVIGCHHPFVLNNLEILVDDNLGSSFSAKLDTVKCYGSCLMAGASFMPFSPSPPAWVYFHILDLSLP